jgi:hypothetical protein
VTTEAVHGDRSRFGRAIGRADGRDFPFSNGQPVEVAWWAWVIIALAWAVGFTALVLMPFPTTWACSSRGHCSPCSAAGLCKVAARVIGWALGTPTSPALRGVRAGRR